MFLSPPILVCFIQPLPFKRHHHLRPIVPGVKLVRRPREVNVENLMKTFPKTNILPLTIDPWKRRFLLETLIFWGRTETESKSP